MDRTRGAGIVTAGLVGIALSFTAGWAVGAGGSSPPLTASQRVGADPVVLANSALANSDLANSDLANSALANSDLATAGSCVDLLDHYVEQGVGRVGPWGWDGDLRFQTRDGATAFSGSDTASSESAQSSRVPQPAQSPQPRSERAESSATGTNVQESGVDEPDVVKTDGERLVRIQDDRLTTYDVTGDAPVPLATLDLPDIADAEILLAGDTVIAIGRDDGPLDSRTGDSRTGAAADRTRVVVLDLVDPHSPAVITDEVYDARLLAARSHGDVVRLVLTNGLPQLDFVEPGFWRSEEAATRHNQQVVRDSTLADWLPTVSGDGDGDADRDGGGDRDGDADPQDLLDCSAVALPDDEDAGLGTMTIVGFDGTSPATREATAVATDSQTVYVSADRLVLATGARPVGNCWDVCLPSPGVPGQGDQGTTRLLSFALSNTSTTYVASGEVDGTVADRWAMDEAGGVLRLAVGPSSSTGDFNSVVTLQERGDSLLEVGRLDGLGVGEEIKSVRWFDELAIVVTFRQTDPLYAVSLTEPAAPVLLGELKIPGFSQYLHPLGARRMIGLGQSANSRTGATTGAQAALFDVADLTSPRRLDVVGYSKGSSAAAGSDPRQFTWLPDRRTALTVISRPGANRSGQTGLVSVLAAQGGRLTNRMVAVEYGEEVAAVRLVPMPDGRVVLVTGDGVSFFDLDRKEGGVR